MLRTRFCELFDIEATILQAAIWPRHRSRAGGRRIRRRWAHVLPATEIVRGMVREAEAALERAAG